MSTKRIEVILDKSVVNNLNYIVANTQFSDRSDFIREAIKEKMKNYEYLVRESDPLLKIVEGLLNG